MIRRRVVLSPEARDDRVTIAFTVTDTQVMILRIFYGGRDWATELSGR